MSAVELAPEAMSPGELRREIDRLRLRVQDLEDAVAAARAAQRAEQRSHLAYRMANPARPKVGHPQMPIRTTGTGGLL